MIVNFNDGSTPLTATVTSPAQDVREVELIALFVNITAISGTSPTLTVKIQESPDGTQWNDTGLTTTALNATGATRVAATVGQKLSKFVRAVATVAGTTPSITATINLAAVKLA